MTARNLNYGAFPLVVESRAYGSTVTSRYPHPPLKSAAESAAVFLRSLRLTPRQLLADRRFLALARAAVAAGKKFTAELCEWEARPVVAEAVRLLAEGIARKAARPRAVTAGQDTTAAARARIAARFADLTGFRAALAGATPGRLMAADSVGSFRFGPVVVTVSQTETCDWDRYSKGWHRAHGPARTRSTSLTVRGRVGHEVRTVRTPLSGLRSVDRRAAEAVAEFLALPRLKGKAGLRIDPHVELTPAESPRRHTAVYARTLAGELLGYVAARGGDHYHDATPAAAADGVARKRASARLAGIRRAAGAAAGIDLGAPVGALLRGFGFCRPGVADALDMLGLSDREYTAEELASAGRWDRLPAVARKYPGEVAEIARRLTGVTLPRAVRGLLAGLVG